MSPYDVHAAGCSRQLSITATAGDLQEGSTNGEKGMFQIEPVNAAGIALLANNQALLHLQAGNCSVSMRRAFLTYVHTNLQVRPVVSQLPFERQSPQSQ